MKPKRVGNYTIDYTKFGLEPETHPVYEYRGYFIARSYSTANRSNFTHFEIYCKFENGKPSEFDFYLNDERGQKRLQDAVSIIDCHLNDRGLETRPRKT